MDESPPRPSKRRALPAPITQTKNKRPHLLKAEERILQSIFAPPPVEQTLNEICVAIDCEIGNTVSVISTSAGSPESAAAHAKTAEIFGLHLFSSAKIVDEHGRESGSLEVYSCDPRVPSADETRLVERALNLAALAIDRETKTVQRADRPISDNQPMARRVLEWPKS